MNFQTDQDGQVIVSDKACWVTPELNELDVSETANGNIGNDGMGGGSQQGGNSSGS